MGNFDTGYVAAMGNLPDRLRAVLDQQNAPATYDEIAASAEWTEIFRTWCAFVQTSQSWVMGFLVWAVPNWHADTDGGMTATPPMHEVHHAYDLLQGAPMTSSRCRQALADIAASTADDDEDGTALAQELCAAIAAELHNNYGRFREDMNGIATAPGSARRRRIAHADGMAEDVAAAIHAYNSLVVDAFPDRHYTDLKAVNWGGTALVLIGSTGYKKIRQFDFTTSIAKRSARVGVGEWVLEDDPGVWRDWIEYELTQCGSKKPVVVGDATKYPEWQESFWPKDDDKEDVFWDDESDA